MTYEKKLQRVFGVDLTQVPGIRTGIAQTLFGEIGPDFTKFRKRFGIRLLDGAVSGQ